MTPPVNYIELNRRFIPVPQDASSEESALQSYTSALYWQIWRSVLTWDDLLKHPLVVLLGEPGSGKTFELQYQATLSSLGCSRFYFRLDDLADQMEQFSPSPDDALRITKWQASRESAVFFLDSVDEAKIRRVTDFHRALDRFRELIGRRALDRATIVISSRVTEWLPTTDGHELSIRFPKQDNRPAESQSKNPYPYVVQLLPLDTAAVTMYAKARRVTNVQQFLDALEKAHAWELARRPADVDDLLAFWLETGNFGTLTQILNFVCDNQLRKTSDHERNELLALERARSGAECLAAATIFCRKFIFRIPSEPNPATQAIDALASLPADWRNEEVRALLNHALFDGASYGHIRFHHRRLSEFLAARWFERLMAQGCPLDELEDLLFDVKGDECVLRPSLAPLAAWLCAGAARWNMVICRQVIKVAPEILLRYGDPAALTIKDRRALLKALLKKADGRHHLWWEHDQATLSRLSDAALADEINELMISASSGRNLRELGLDLAMAGGLTECAATVLEVAISNLETGKLFSKAARTLKAIGGDEELHALAAAAKSVDQFSARVCLPLCELLFPRVWSDAALFQALDRMNSDAQGVIGWDYGLSKHLASVTNRTNCLALLKGLLRCPTKGSDDEDEYGPAFSIRAALKVSNVMLGWSAISGEEASAIAEVLVRVENQGHLSKEDFNSELTERHPQVRERYFRLAAEQLAKEYHDKEVRLSGVVIFHKLLKPTEDDLSWVLAWFQSAASKSERQRALVWALELWQETGRSCKVLARVKEATKQFSDMRRVLRRWLHPGFVARANIFWRQHIRFRFYLYRWRSSWRKVKQPLLKLRVNWKLWWHREKLRSGEYIGWLTRFASEACSKSHNQWSPNDWSLLVKKRGAKCAAAVKEGCKRVWECYQPLLPHESKPNEGETYGTLAGLAGLMVAWQENQLNFTNLSLSEALRATRYALRELNGFTPWFDDLVYAQPQAVQSVLIECISGEWEILEDSKHHHLVLHNLACTESTACKLIKSALMKRLIDSEPKNSHVLRDALCILMISPPSESVELAALAALRSSAISVLSPSFPQWMALWLQCDALPALDTLESLINSVTDPTQVMTAICANLSSRSGYRLPLLPNPSWVTPTAMRRVIPMVYRYIQLEDDIDRSDGGGYSPTARDEAQDFRNGLLDKLVAADSQEVGTVIRELLSEPLLAHLSDYMQYLLESHRQRSAEGPAWRASDVRTFAAEYEREPRSDLDLFKIGRRRLLDLKRWVEVGEDSPREEVNQANKESGFRRWLQRRLNEQARGRYVVPQEWEIDGAARTDLRLVIPNVAPVSLELKIADNWTLQELLNGLEDQLVTTYLRDHKARCGIYVLALFNRNRQWKLAKEQPQINCEQMLDILRKRVGEILRQRENIDGLEVVLIHFSPPNRQMTHS